MQVTRPDYFQTTTPVETMLRRIKGNYRRALVLASIENDGPDSFAAPLTAEEVLQVFSKSDPCACLQSCTQRFSSDFYPNLDELADELGIKQVWED